MSPAEKHHSPSAISWKKKVVRSRIVYTGFELGQLLAIIFRAERGVPLFILCIFAFYGICPLLVGYFLHSGQSYFIDLGWMAILSSLCIYIGYAFCDLIRVKPIVFQKLTIAPVRLAWVLIIAYVALQAALILTAPAVPILSAIAGAPADQLAIEREEFLKTRSEWERALVYMNAAFAGSLIPYVVALSFYARMRQRWLIFSGFLGSCTIFLEKAFFLKAILPIIAVFSRGDKRAQGLTGIVCIFAVSVLLIITSLSGAGRGDVAAGDQGLRDYVSSTYLPQGPIDHLLWRTFSVPLFTAADSLEVIQDRYEGVNMNGATSSFFSVLFNMERIEFERAVFSFQWGQNVTGTGSSNSIFFIEAFANFGYTGVVLFSLSAGLILWWMRSHVNLAMGALWPLFALGLFISGFIGIMLSNGFLITFFLASLTKWDSRHVFISDKLRPEQS